jgi:predicted porin
MRLESKWMRCAIALAAAVVGGNGGAYAQSAEGAAQKEEGEAGAHRFLEPKPGKGATFYTPGGELTIYGHLDVSFDVTTKGISDLRDESGNAPPGSIGWMPALSTNLSYVGVRGFQGVGSGLRFVYQLETQLDIAATSGFANSNSNSSATVKGALTSRNSYVGLAGGWGALKGGKTDAPYKISTGRMNPFLGMIGDYGVVMGNTGGDNRVEFGTRLDHSVWYESPNLSGLSVAVLFSPGQNRSGESDQIPAGSVECTGGNIPGSGGTGTPGGAPIACNDGSFGDAVSGSVAFEAGPIYFTAAYERHFAVNRNSDVYGIYGFPLPAAISDYDRKDVADEDAGKVGVQWKGPTGTTVSAIYENMHRYVPSVLKFQNERQRWGTWLAVSQQLGPADSLHVGWAHAAKAQGDPGQHNTATADVGNGGAAGGLGVDNSSNMITAALKHELGPHVLAYVAWAGTFNAHYAHYDLGAGGRAVTTDCHDGGLPASGDVTSNPHCWAGGKLMGVSAGLSSSF